MGRLQRQVHRLEQMPQRMDALAVQIVQLRAEMRIEFSAIRGEMREDDQETRRGLREEIRAALQDMERVLSNQMRELFEANKTHMLVLHEDLVQRIATIKGG